MKRFFVCHTRGPNFDILRKAGFVVLFPQVDDYVFLEDTPSHALLLRRQTELGIYFLKDKAGEMVTVSEQEVLEIKSRSVDRVVLGSEIKVVAGPYENLDGVVEEDLGPKVRCNLQGYNRTYCCVVSRSDVVLQGEEHVATVPEWCAEV